MSVSQSPLRRKLETASRARQEKRWAAANGPLITYKPGEEPPSLPTSSEDEAVSSEVRHHPMSEAAGLFRRPVPHGSVKKKPVQGQRSIERTKALLRPSSPNPTEIPLKT